MILENVRVGELDVNCYILADHVGAKAIIIDPGADEEKIRAVLAKHQLNPGLVINTHGHYDHIGCDDKFGVKIYAHRQEVAILKSAGLNFSSFLSGISFSVKSDVQAVDDKETINFEGLELEVIHVPGHSPGAVALLLKKPKKNILFSGDSLFCQSIGRTDFAGASHELLVKSIKERLFVLPEDTVVYPGHGPATTIGEEKSSNPFLN